MLNFDFKRPTEFVFGRDAENKVGELLVKYGATKVLVHYGGGSVVRSGLMERVEKSMKDSGISYIKLGGVVPNPEDTLVYEGIELCRKEKVDFILAVGGGSAIDSAKAIAAGVPYDGDFWEFYGKNEGVRVPITKALPVGTVLTIPAAGSEGSPNTVISRVTADGPVLKRGAGSLALVPVFSVLNPELNYTLPAYQTAAGVVDMMAHVFERYFTNTQDVELTDRLCEAILLAVIKYAPIAINEPDNYAARANITWAGTVAHNDTCGVGRQQDWATHALEHELSAFYGVAHGAGLAVMFPAWMEYVYTHDLYRFKRFAVNVWGIKDSGDKLDMAKKGIKATKDFFKLIGMPTNFAEMDVGATKEDIPKILEVLKENLKGRGLGNFVPLTLDDARKIYEIAAQ
jgi:hypothetical protein